MSKKLILLLFFLPLQWLSAQTSLLTDFPKGYTPKEVGKRLASHFVDGKHNLYAGRTMTYPEAFTWNGSLKYAAATHNRKLLKLLQDNFEPMFAEKSTFMPGKDHVDKNMFGSLPLLLFQITKEKRYLELGLPYADSQWEVPANAEPAKKEWADKGYSWQTRLWIDDMYMIPVVQTQAYKVTGDSKYLERAAKQMALYLDELQRPNGLFYHAPDVPYYWGRGNGWMAAGMADVLRCLPQDSPYRPRIMQGFLTMMKSLKQYQTESGLWNQLIDQPDCWIETSGSAMFTYAFIEGVKNGWLDANEYAPAARKAWMALVSYIDKNDNVREVCVGTNKKNDKQYYYDRPRNTGDYHGQAPYLWCAVALMEK